MGLSPPPAYRGGSVKLGDNEAKSLKEMSGKLSVQAFGATEELVRVKGVLGSAGMTFAGKDGNVIHMKSVDKQEDGSYRVCLALENPTIQDPFAGRNIRFRGNFNNNLNGVPYNVQTNMPKMVDAAGRECPAEVVSQGANTLSGGQSCSPRCSIIARPGSRATCPAWPTHRAVFGAVHAEKRADPVIGARPTDLSLRAVAPARNDESAT